MGEKEFGMKIINGWAKEIIHHDCKLLFCTFPLSVDWHVPLGNNS